MTNEQFHRTHRKAIRIALRQRGISTAGVDIPNQIAAFIDACNFHDYSFSQISEAIELNRHLEADSTAPPRQKPSEMMQEKHDQIMREEFSREIDALVIPEAPSTKPAAPKHNDAALAMSDAIAGVLHGMIPPAAPAITEAQVLELIAQHGGGGALKLEIKPASEKPAITIEGAHCKFPLLLDIVQLAPTSGQNLYMYGPAGSGKTTIGKQLAEALSLPFYSTGAIFDKFELLGFNDVTGKYIETELFKAYTEGGLFLFDEIDGSAPEVLTAFNQLLANDEYAFPNGMQKKHVDFYAVAAANTNGLGATGAYSSRATLDGATLDRFTIIELGYDEALEKAMAHATAAAVDAEYNRATVERWLAEVLSTRKWLADNNSDVIVSPRASKGGAALLARGHDLETVREITLHAHLSADQIKRIAA